MPSAPWRSVPLLVFVAACSRQPGERSVVPAISPGTFSTSLACRECHKDIYAYWRSSAHAESYRNRNFQLALHVHRDRIPKEALRDCLACHAPLTASAAKELADEGVTCDFCHSIKSVRKDGQRWRYQVEPGIVKRGPGKDIPPDRHQMAHSELFAKSEICAGCHEYVSSTGLPILTTYSEWKASPAAQEGRTCQGCHMPAGSGNIVDPKVRRTSAPVSTHRMESSSDPAQLRAALRLRIASFERDGGEAEAVVAVENLGTGHHAPTGMPTHRLVLEVEIAASGGQRVTERRVYQRRLVDARGLTVVTDTGAFVDAAKLAEDTRLKAGETRRETVRFPLPEGETAKLRASLFYAHASEPLARPVELVGVADVTKSLSEP